MRKVIAFHVVTAWHNKDQILCLIINTRPLHLRATYFLLLKQ